MFFLIKMTGFFIFQAHKKPNLRSVIFGFFFCNNYGLVAYEAQNL